jgi:5-methylthioadenosine/S-adenosylhomocysteine deaminase
VAEYLARGITVGLGADAAACSNGLDAWAELRLAGLLAKLRGGAAAIPARHLFELATVGGARALGLEREAGSIEPGKQADLVVLDLRTAHGFGPDSEGGIYTQLVYGARAADVRAVVVAGRVLVEDGRLAAATGLDLPRVLAEAVAARRAVLARVS